MASTPRNGWSERHDEAARAAGRASWAAWVAEVERQKGRAVCGRLTRSGGPCARSAGHGTGLGKGACSLHGGASRAGPASGTWRNGGRSKYAGQLSGKLGETFEELRAIIADAFDLTEEARLLDARMAEAVRGAVDSGPLPGTLRPLVARARAEVRRSLNGEPSEALPNVLRELHGALSAAQLETSRWREWERCVNLKRKLADTHSRQQAREHGPVSWADVATVIDRVRAIVLELLPPSRLPDFIREMRRLGAVPGIEALGSDPDDPVN